MYQPKFLNILAKLFFTFLKCITSMQRIYSETASTQKQIFLSRYNKIS